MPRATGAELILDRDEVVRCAVQKPALRVKKLSYLELVGRPTEQRTTRDASQAQLSGHRAHIGLGAIVCALATPATTYELGCNWRSYIAWLGIVMACVCLLCTSCCCAVLFQLVW